MRLWESEKAKCQIKIKKKKKKLVALGALLKVWFFCAPPRVEIKDNWLGAKQRQGHRGVGTKYSESDCRLRGSDFGQGCLYASTHLRLTSKADEQHVLDVSVRMKRNVKQVQGTTATRCTNIFLTATFLKIKYCFSDISSQDLLACRSL